jgi:hypothetical protein
MSFIVYVALCAVLFERGVIVCVMCIFVLGLNVVPLPPDKNPFAVQLNNNIIKCKYEEH